MLSLTKGALPGHAALAVSRGDPFSAQAARFTLSSGFVGALHLGQAPPHEGLRGYGGSLRLDASRQRRLLPLVRALAYLLQRLER